MKMKIQNAKHGNKKIQNIKMKIQNMEIAKCQTRK